MADGTARVRVLRPGPNLKAGIHTLPTGQAGILIAAGIARPAPERPPTAGAGSGRDVWAEYAATQGLQVPDDAPRDYIIALLDGDTGDTDHDDVQPET